MNVPVQNGNLPSGFCPANYQEMVNAFSAVQYINIDNAGNRIIVSTTKPTDTTLIWLRLDSFGRPLRYYYFSQGAWLSLHPIVPGLTQWWFDTAPDFNTFDGGDANPISDISGPMWQLAKNKDGNVIAAKFPIANGTLPSGTVLNPGDTGGEEKHQLTVPELPKTKVKTNIPLVVLNTGTNVNGVINAQTASGSVTFESQEFGGDVAHNNLPLYVVGVLMQRSTRLFYAVT